ncbi:hypothetical protein RE628_09910 [Paenibacillus sp. D2_2]|uniref:hypothetical protein n=1 Tax=Paenibacillus sp. D2_2 TaxID=3073092 RepID=UPI0028157B2E|nr:hypothetical protein [Paenibacillus sp. D2_2]WMT42604.1 hypothetical protein RE628_09910 [Paenibacillus sp. D2_2]
MKKQAIVFWALIALAAFGIIDGLFGRGTTDWMGILIPALIVGIVFLLYKYPPRKYRRQNPKVKPSARTMSKLAAERRSASSGQKRKAYPFQVIEGQKGKNDDDLPKYH